MDATPHDSLCGDLSRLLSTQAVQERNKALARALLAAGHHAARYESVVAENDRVTARITLTGGPVARCLIAEFRFDAQGEVSEYRDFLVPAGSRPTAVAAVSSPAA
ncbi:hypothetical protein ACFVQ0_36600 [Streptomyces sp. NPDC057900]|uniref:hypothetical protein n=1 Tax=Streptomyces sp. NPDC057900 TaxID=3346274 RepID=UPI0036E0BB66